MRAPRIRSALVSLAVAAALVAAPAASASPETGAPGEVTSVAPLPDQHWLPGTGKAYQLTYTTTGPVGLTPSTGALFVPKGTPPPGGWPVVSWAHGTTGIGDRCAPSTAGRSPRDIGYLTKWLEQGYAIAATDYVGLGTEGVHPYLDGRSEAHAVIDIVRAASTVDGSVSRKWITVGQSQGGHAALFTTRMAPEYAPELDFRGGVATGAASNITWLLELAGPDVPFENLTALVAYILAGVPAARPGLDVAPYLTERGGVAVRDAHELCVPELYASLAGVTVGQLLRGKLAEGDFIPAAREVLEVPVDGYRRPFFVAHGSDDNVVPPFLTEKLLDALNGNGQPVTAKFYPGDHGSTMDLSLVDTIPYARQLFAG
ncbi:secretory lipase [Herbihabitans rhizosphaerae]|uniref:Secretory lipase n=1 Tax=Herbihabitans rhizosphaerae TaxID=1872711 RepID=A0A4Q7KWL6_9PSEU|nr:lipase family protein [Herbihabitans rhizosphaerae]RZS41164.1 secretory lipase [Herbihabitans rhizosphaerae]